MSPKSSRRSLVVALRRLRCPRCHSTDVKTTGTLQSTPELIARRVRCRACGQAFVVIFD